ncbi:Anaphase-promoting complex subunit 7 [Dissophora globulifera]|nr:Anaphase-promoting complex subunit 7 [Dissophora globulifera]
MDANERSTFMRRERLEQLSTAEALYDAGLYTSSQLMEYYRKASNIWTAIPPEPTTSGPVTGRSEIPPPQSQPELSSSASEHSAKRKLTPLDKQIQDRERLRSRFTKATMANKERQEGHLGVVTGNATHEINAMVGGLANVATTSTSPVVLRPGTLKSVASRRSELEDMDDLDEQATIEYAQACCEEGYYSSAEEELMRIPQRKRKVPVYLMLIQITNKRRLALTEKTCWERILEIQPLAIEAYIRLLSLKSPLDVVLNMIPPGSREKSWMTKYLKAVDNMMHMRYQEAAVDFEALDAQYPRNVDILLRLAVCERWCENFVNAGMYFYKIRKLDCHVVQDMFQYGVCLQQMSKSLYLNKVAKDLMASNSNHPDVWCLAALYFTMKLDKEKALLMLSRALKIKPDHSGALQLRGQIYLESAPQKALQVFKAARMVSQDIDIYDGLVNSYLLLERHVEAQETANEAKTLFKSAHALALYGQAVYQATDQGADAAIEILQEALRMKQDCFEAASCLVMIYENQGKYEDAIDILNPQNARAKSGLANVGKILHGAPEDEDDDDEDDDAEETDNEGDDLLAAIGDIRDHFGDDHMDDDEVLASGTML